MASSRENASVSFIPTYKSEPNLPFLIDRLTKVLSKARISTKSSLSTIIARIIRSMFSETSVRAIPESRSSACLATSGSKWRFRRAQVRHGRRRHRYG